MQNLNFFVHGCMTTPNFSGNDLGKILAFYVGRYDDKDV
jgi:hypothetical protein